MNITIKNMNVDILMCIICYLGSPELFKIKYIYNNTIWNEVKQKLIDLITRSRTSIMGDQIRIFLTNTHKMNFTNIDHSYLKGIIEETFLKKNSHHNFNNWLVENSTMF